VDTLDEMFRHHGWATVTLIDRCESLSMEQLHTPVPGAYGPVLPTLVHLVVADQRYLKHVTGIWPEQSLEPGMEPPLAELRSRIEEQTRRWLALVDRRDELNVTLTLPAEDGWPVVPHAEHLLFLQAIHHGNDHRTQICSMLGALGLDVPDLGGWDYWEATHLR
jgi:uncharacterized damage-inducible protein DinB